MAFCKASDHAVISSVRDWWDQHPMNYQGYVRYLPQTDDDYREFFRQADAGWWRNSCLVTSPNAAYAGDLLLCRERVAGKRVLEIGCGMGFWTQTFAEWGCDVTAIDLAPHSIQMTGKRLELAGLKADLRQMDARGIDAIDGPFDFIWSWGVIHHSPDTEQIARKIGGLLKPGGEFGIMIYYTWSMYSLYVLIRLGILQGRLWRHPGWNELQSRYSDGAEHGGAPLARSWSRRGMRRLLAPLVVERFSHHAERETALILVPSRFGIRNFVARHLSVSVQDGITARFGHALYAYGHKPSSVSGR
ncbi:MAG: class I SAM-dependent methyltransferase [Magnetococcales bacterium]|nr:class I SAM-dependent methyltransferase [Magnetococcales bacterium]